MAYGYISFRKGLKDEYHAFYKYYSKYVHPSRWIVLADEDEYNTWECWETFIINTQLYGHRLRERGQEILKKRSDFIRKN